MTRFHRGVLSVFAALLVALTAWGALAQDPVISRQEPLPVPTITIYPGDTISQAMLSERYFPAGTTARFPVAGAPDIVVGKVARRTLLPGKAIPLNAIAQADAVVRGTTTQAIFSAGGLTMTTLVTPLQSGAVGATIQARNLDSGQVIAGLAQADGTIRVGGQ